MRRSGPHLRALALTALLGQLLPGCGHLDQRAEERARTDGLAEVDALMRQRADPARLEEALQAIDGLMLDLGDDPRLLARLAMAHYAMAYGHAPDAPPPARLFEAGREIAWRCIYQDPSFEGVLTSTGGRIGPAAAGRLGEEHERCLLWLVSNWTRWLALRDPAGFAIDLEPLQVLADRSVELSSGTRRAQALGMAGVSRALAPPSFGPDLEQARVLLIRAIEHDPDNLSLRVDLVEYVYLPTDDHDSARETLETVLAIAPERGGRWGLENQRAHVRAQGLLEALR